MKTGIDRLRFSYGGELFAGQGFMEWNPTDGFHLEALLDKNFAPVDSFKTLGQVIINDKGDAFNIWLKVRGFGSAIAPNVFPLAQKQSLITDNHLSLSLKRIIFFFQWPKEPEEVEESWMGSAVFLTKTELEFPDSVKLETSLAGRLIEAQSTTGLSHEDKNNVSFSGRQLTNKSFELNWALSKSCWTKTDAWHFGEAARRALSIIFAQTIWIAKTRIRRGHVDVLDLRKHETVESLKYNFRPLIDIDHSGLKQRTFNKDAFLQLIVLFSKGGNHAETCWNIFHQMADASRQETWQCRELLLSTILEAIFRTINNRPFKAGGFYRAKDRKEDMERFQRKFLAEKWGRACENALRIHTRLRHRNAHPDWLTTPNGVLSKEELRQSTANLIFLSRFYGYMILAMAGFKDLEPLFPVVRFSDDLQPPTQSPVLPPPVANVQKLV
ncbi:MAG: hypothetical protein JWR26_2763 [Pedosphaera sp.]|nr:hypothetical protein [Pedosphaera sp.]